MESKRGVWLNWNEKITVGYGIRCVTPSPMPTILETFTTKIQKTSHNDTTPDTSGQIKYHF